MDHIMGVDALALRLGVPVTLGTVAHAVVTAGRPSRFPRPLHLLRAIPTYFLQGAPLVPVVDLRRGLDFGFPWSKNRFRAPLAAFAADPEPLPGLPGWRVLDTPGHADDAICLYHAAAGFLVAGDTIRNFLGGEWNPLLCDAAAYADTRRRLAELPVRTIFPGHGPLIEGEAAMHALRTLPAWMP
jgi:glyoxylase-like metal-dependent hydrolase (beta-lactamase superfamily II)